jgi:hypothetical protein
MSGSASAEVDPKVRNQAGRMLRSTGRVLKIGYLKKLPEECAVIDMKHWHTT